MDLKKYIRDIPDFPAPGVMFHDVTPLLANPRAFHAAINQLAQLFADQEIDAIAAPEARGFIFASALAYQLNISFIPVRKPGKLPAAIVSRDYELEYGQNTLSMHADALQPKQRVLVVDDVLASGGTAHACCDLIKQLQADVIGCAFLIEIATLEGRKKLAPYPVESCLTF